MLGVVHGRRRLGKTYLLSALSEQTGGFTFEATQDTESMTLGRLGRELAAHMGAPAPLHFDDWGEAVDALLRLGSNRPTTVVLDEFPYLAQSTPSIASIIQRAFSPRRPERLASQVRLILCGSALAFMGNLLTGQAPLRGRSSLDLVVPPLDFREHRAFWGIDNERIAAQLFAITGGTPAYRTLARGGAPHDERSFARWVCSNPLSSSSPLFREAHYLLTEDLDVRDPQVYNSILGAAATGSTTRTAIATQVGRKVTDIAHHLSVLESTGYLTKVDDAFSTRKPRWHIADQIIRFDRAVMQPAWSRLSTTNDPAPTWELQQGAFRSQVLGPQFENMCRDWVQSHADPSRFNAEAITRVAPAVVSMGGRDQAEIDVVVFGVVAGRTMLVSIGECKWSETVTPAHVARLERVRSRLGASGVDVSRTSLAFYSGQRRGTGVRGNMPAGLKHVDIAEIYGAPAESD
jgi:AAA+ ATPase superfamily predicted ATPase